MYREPQQERSRAMRERLLEACAEVLVERGFAHTTTTLVSERAGVSRGAQLHHFPSKNDLVIGALEYVTTARGQELERAFGSIPTGPSRTTEILQVLSDYVTSPVFTAALELWVAARTDPVLNEAVAPLERRIGRETHRLTAEALHADESQPGARELVQTTLDLLRGLALANTLTDDRQRRGRILAHWASVLDQSLPRTEGPRPA